MTPSPLWSAPTPRNKGSIPALPLTAWVTLGKVTQPFRAWVLGWTRQIISQAYQNLIR